jgi:hypothetical protein
VIKIASRRAAVVLAGSALALAGGLVPAQAATTGWRVDTTIAVRGSANLLSSVTAVSPSDAWATGLVGKTSGTALPHTYIRHWTGKAWRRVTLPATIARQWARQDPVFSEVGASSARSVWVFGGLGGGYLRLSGSRWSIGRLPGAGRTSSVQIYAAKVFSSTNVWAFGARNSASGTQLVTAAYAAHYNGHTWVQVTVPGSFAITAVSAASSSQMWAVEGSVSFFGTSVSPGPTPPVVLHWTASTGWQEASAQPTLAKGDELTSVVAEPNGDVWFGGSAKNTAKGRTPLAAEWNGSSWSPRHLLMRATSAKWEIGGMTPDGTGGIWAQASDSQGSQIWRLHSGRWSQVRPAFGKRRWILQALALVPGTQSVWAVGAVRVGKSSADGLIAVDGPLPR